MNAMVINQCSTNKGDRAVLFAILRELKANGIRDISVSTSVPSYWSQGVDIDDINVQFVPWGWGKGRKSNPNLLDKILYRFVRNRRTKSFFPRIRRSLLENEVNYKELSACCDPLFVKALEKSDLVISTGGHHITTIIAGCMVTGQIYDMALALLWNKPLLLWSQSVGTFDFKDNMNRDLVKKILSDSSQIWIRDNSESEIKKLDLPLDNVRNTAETVFSLYDLVEKRVSPLERDAKMGLSVWTGRKTDPKVRQEYIENLASLVKHAVVQGYQILMFPMELEGYDIPYLRDIINEADIGDKGRIITDWPNTPSHINEISKCRMFVGHKTHSVVFSLVSATPLLAISYHKKTNDFMAQYGLSDYCIDDSDVTSAKLIEIFDNMQPELNNIYEIENKYSLELSQKVKTDFAEMIDIQMKKR